MKKHNLAALIGTTILTLATSLTVFAGSWKQDNVGWWYQRDNGSYPASTWEWIDGNNDGISECYYFNPEGYCLLNTKTPDGYQVDGNGAWIKDGIVQTKKHVDSVSVSAASGSRIGKWVKDENGYRWQYNDGRWPSNTWEWIDVAQNRLEYRYYFDENGYRLENAITPDGQYVNIEGQWMDGNTVMTKYSTFETVEEYRNWFYSKTSVPFLVDEGNNTKLVLSTAGNIYYRTDGWYWLDLDGDWKEEKYYFDAKGNMVKNSIIQEHPRNELSIVEGGEVNEHGAWVIDGVVQTQEMTKPVYSGLLYERPRGTELTDPNSFSKVSFNQELVDYVNWKSHKSFVDFKKQYPSTLIREEHNGSIPFRYYSTKYRNASIRYGGYEDKDHIRTFIGTVAQLLDGVPESGVEANALLVNTGYEKGGIFASTGTIDGDFGLPTGRYRMLHLEDRENNVQCFIVVNVGTDGKWYIYPESQVMMN